MAPALRKLLQRVIHTSPVCSYTQAFRTRHTHFPLFVCQRRLRAIVFMFMENSSFTKWTATHTHIGRHITQQQHAIVDSTRVVKALHESFSPDCSSTQAFRTRLTHFSLFVCQRRLRAIVFMFMDNSSFTNWTATHTHIGRHITQQQHAIVESTRVVKAFLESYGSIDSWGQLCDGII